VSTPTPAWEAFGHSSTGAHKHINQDRYTFEPLGNGDGLVLAVADGHGSAAHPRSHIGAEQAIRAFLQGAAAFHASIKTGEPPSKVKARAEEDLPRNLVRAWQQRVTAHVEENPDDGQDRGAALAVLYGTTLIGVLITGTLVVGWQLGDGDLCFIEADGEITTPLRRDVDSLGDETDSLCSGNAQLLMRTCWRRGDGTGQPVLVAVSTDGLSKSFVSFDSFKEFLSGLHGRLRTDGTAKVQEEIPGWLQKASSFSGDDATLVIAWRAHH